MGLPSSELRRPPPPADMLLAMEEVRAQTGVDTLRVRIGLNSGPITAGVIRTSGRRFQMFGETLTRANQLESTGSADRIHVGPSTFELLKDRGTFIFEERGLVEVPKAKGRKIPTYWLVGRVTAPGTGAGVSVAGGHTTAPVPDNPGSPDEPSASVGPAAETVGSAAALRASSSPASSSNAACHNDTARPSTGGVVGTGSAARGPSEGPADVFFGDSFTSSNSAPLAGGGGGGVGPGRPEPVLGSQHRASFSSSAAGPFHSAGSAEAHLQNEAPDIGPGPAGPGSGPGPLLA